MTSRTTFINHYRTRDKKTWPVWEPGTHIACGDIGTFRKGRFEKTGHLDELQAGLLGKHLTVETASIGGREEFNRDFELSFDGSADITPTPGTKIRAEIKFTSKSGLYFEAIDIAEHRLKELGIIKQLLKEHKLLKKGMIFVSNVRTMARGLILISEDNGWKLSASGTMPLPPVTLASTSLGITGKKGSGYKKVINGDESNYPFAMQVQGLHGWWKTDIDLQSVSQSKIIDNADFVDVTSALNISQ